MSEIKCPGCGCKNAIPQVGNFWVCTNCHLKWWQGRNHGEAPAEDANAFAKTHEELRKALNKAAQEASYSTMKEEPKDKKYDQGKPMAGLMKNDFPRALLAVAEITTYGVKKYNQPGSWRLVEDGFKRYEDALGRHDLQAQVEDYCAESGKLHLAHRAWNALATLELFLTEQEK